jgi:hypothetical protein
MNYLEARSQIQNGDIIFFGKSKQIFSQFESLWCDSPYTHAAIAFRIPMGDTDRVFVVEQHSGGQRIVNMASYMSDRKLVEVIKAPISWDLYGDDLLSGTGFLEYAYTALPAIGIREKFGLKFNDAKGEVCSEMVARVLVSCGVKIPTTQVSPGMLLKHLLNLGFKSRLTITNVVV